MEIEEGGARPLRRETEAHRFLQVMADAFGCRILPELGGLSVNDLYEYLRDPRNTRCPSGSAKEMTSLLHQATRGNYEATVTLIHRGRGDHLGAPQRAHGP